MCDIIPEPLAQKESTLSTKHPRRWRCPIAFFCSRAAVFMIGQSINIDGGVSM
jgi:hypothetical protein